MENELHLPGDAFVNGLLQTFQQAQLPAALLDDAFSIAWCSEEMIDCFPLFALPDGARALLAGYHLEHVRGEINTLGHFTTSSIPTLFGGRSVRLMALPQEHGTWFLVLPSDLPEPRSFMDVMRPSGQAGSIASFETNQRVPLNSIFSSLHVLYKELANLPGGASEKALRYLQNIEQNAYCLLRSNQWVAEYSKLVSGVAKPNPSDFDLYAYLREFAEAATQLCEPLGIPFTSSLPHEMLHVRCDRTRLELALCNLLSNSCQYSRPGNGMHLQAAQAGGQVIVTLSDRGIGMAPEVLEHACDAFYSYRNDGLPYAGNGLGLTLVKLAAGMLGGTLVLQSRLGEGTTASLSFKQVTPEYDALLRSTPPDFLENKFSLLRIAMANTMQALA